MLMLELGRGALWVPTAAVQAITAARHVQQKWMTPFRLVAVTIAQYEICPVRAQ
jgi:hypothetical protein